MAPPVEDDEDDRAVRGWSHLGRVVYEVIASTQSPVWSRCCLTAQSILAPAPLPAMRSLRALAALLIALPLAAQTKVTRDASVRATPTGNVIAQLRSGTSWQTGPVRNGFAPVTVEGWVDASRFSGRRDTFPESIGGDIALRIREQPSMNGKILGEFRPGAGLNVLQRRGSWARIRRVAYVEAAALDIPVRPAARPSPAPVRPAPAAAAPARAAAQTPEDEPSAEESPTQLPGAFRNTKKMEFRSAPSGRALGAFEPGAVLQPITRDRGWVKVRVEAWVPESELSPADTAFGATITATDLRLDPVGMRGRVVRWEVQVIGVQIADPLRRDLARDEPYLLAMGPSGENAVLYLAIPPSLLSEARAMAPLAKAVITARVRVGRSEPTGAPVLDLMSIAKR